MKLSVDKRRSLALASIALAAAGCATTSQPTPTAAPRPLLRAAAPTVTTTPPASRSRATSFATWVWDEAIVLDPAKQRSLLQFARAKRLSTLFLHASASFERLPEFERLTSFALSASQQGLAITLVGGDPAWTLAAHRADALAFLTRVSALHARLAARGLQHDPRILFDVEPYLLPQWQSAPAEVSEQYLDLLDALRTQGHSASLAVWHTIPFWFATQTQTGTPLDQQVLARSDGAVVMAYRDQASQVVSLAAPVLQHAAALEKPVMVAVETLCVTPAYVSFCGASASALADALGHVDATLREFPAFGGLAVHQYSSWQSLEGREK